MPASFLSHRRLLILIAVAIAARLLIFGDPVVHVDEEFYFVTAHAMWHGAVPFIDIWDRKPVGLFLLYALPAGLGLPWGIWAYQLMALAATIATGWAIGRFADRIGFGAGGTAAGIAYILWLDTLGGQGGQSPVFYNWLTIAAALLILSPGNAPRRRGIAAMALIGVALQIKYSVVFEGIAFGLWLLWEDWRGHRRIAAWIAYGVALVATALLPTALAAAWYAGHGYWDAFVFANFESIFLRNADPLAELAGNLGQIALIVSPIVALAIVALVRAAPLAALRRERRFAVLWLAAAIVGVLLFRPWFDHYGLPLLPPACACAAGMLGSAGWRRRYTPALLALVAIAGQIVVLTLKLGRGDAAQFAALSRAVGEGPGCLFVYSGTTMLYASTERCMASRYLVPSHLSRTREMGAVGVDQNAELRRILVARPAVIVMRPPYIGERPAATTMVLAAIARSYRQTAALPMGNETIRVYKLAR